MSGHNPHSRVSQPVNSSSWNHLQVPSYMPRQPQLAHMSSERTLRSSPLIWPNTNPADAFYNYMALTAAAAVANSNPKNASLDINPLLPFVRSQANAMPFNSVDLSLSSSSTLTANRNSLTPSPRNQLSPGSTSSNNRFPKITSDGDDTANNGANKIDNNKLNTDPLAFLNEMSEQLASMRSNRNLAVSNAIPRDSFNESNNDLSNFRINGGNDKSKQRTEPMELGREKNPTNPFENESLSQSFHLQQLLGLTPPVTSSITPNISDLSKSLLSIFNNTTTASPLLISPKSTSNFNPHHTDASKNSLNTSNDDSLDSQSGICNGDDGHGKQLNTRYRRRKPQKTIRMSNDVTDSIAGPLNTEKSNIAKNEHKNDTNNSNGINSFSTFHTDTNNITPQTNPMTQSLEKNHSIDLSHHCANQEMFENGLVKFNKTNNVDLENPTAAVDRSDKTTNLLPSEEMNSLNLFGGVNFGHLRGTNLTNDIATFPNTDDLVKKVEELVKCNEHNGFANTDDFSPIELTKCHADKLIASTYENSQMENGISDGLNTSIDSKCNGYGIKPAISENKVSDQNGSVTATLSSETSLPVSNSQQNAELNATSNCDVNSGNKFCIDNEMQDRDALASFTNVNSVDKIYTNLSNDTKNQSNIDANMSESHENAATNGVTESEVAKSMLSASSSETTTNTSPTPKKKTANKKNVNNRCRSKANKSNASKSNQSKNTKSNDSKQEKKSDIKKTKPTKDESGSESSSKFRGPYVHVDRDGTLEVINAPLNEEIAEKQSKFKKNYIVPKPIDRNKVRGLHVSTLSNKYDAITTDISWMCVFCKLGPHKYGLGDLFGPFILSTESEDFQLVHINPKDDIFTLQRKKQSNMLYPQNISAIAAKAISKSRTIGNQVAVKKKRKLSQMDSGGGSNTSTNIEINAQPSPVDIFYGMTQANDSSYEVWAHEDCLVWASGVHIIGARVVGLETAVWGCVRHQCSVCKQYGAMLSCLQRSCHNEVHVPCAKRSGWCLDEHSFQSRCSEHALAIKHDDEHNKNN